ncbi:LysE family translocator [Nesterenkonia sp. E16_7]|uniref:LysE family transporter n=1 Tax=unclassified Nesterenkonia TaxID=2629769 RepID=UPI001A926FBE|nr:LysE family translocator [Nesterenkonia sp. E16_10]MBO0599855.1 LysE family translocator [Nesterenkonia sp. E16_7]
MAILSLILFVVAGAGTPGPNNTIVMASGAAYGFRRTLPAVLGVNVGFPSMVLIVGIGLGQVLEQWPVILDILRPIGILYLLWLAYKIATGPTTLTPKPGAKPPGFVQMALFQFVNPKAWTLSVAALSTFTGFWDSFMLEVAVIALVACSFGAPFTVAWTLLGVGAGRIISQPKHMLIFNLVMAGLLVASVVPAMADTWESLPL